jgi:hypothetical protein
MAINGLTFKNVEIGSYHKEIWNKLLTLSLKGVYLVILNVF